MRYAHTKEGPEYNITLHISSQVHKYLILQTRFFVHESKSDSEFKQRKVN
jgi:hypothetical protein